MVQNVGPPQPTLPGRRGGRVQVGVLNAAGVAALFVVIGPFWAMRDLPDVEAGEPEESHSAS